MRIDKRWVAVFATLVLLVGACGDSGGGAEPNTLSFTITDTGYTDLPVSLEAGIYTVTVRNDSASDADVDLIEGADRTPEQFLNDIAPVLEGAPIPEYMKSVTGIGTIPSGGSRTTTLTLPPATFMVLNTSAEGQPQIARLEVTGDRPAADDLPDGPSITARDYAFDVDGITAGSNTVTFVNLGPDQIHHAVLMAFPEGTSPEEAEAAIGVLFGLGDDEAPPEGTPLPEDLASTGVFSAGNGGTFTADFEAGRTYGVFCFISDRAGSAPHAFAYEMYEYFTVEG